MCRPFGTRLINLSLPGTAVPGYRLCRPLRDCLTGTPKSQKRELGHPLWIRSRQFHTSVGMTKGVEQAVQGTTLESCPETEQFLKGREPS